MEPELDDIDIIILGASRAPKGVTEPDAEWLVEQYELHRAAAALWGMVLKGMLVPVRKGNEVAFIAPKDK